jgi:ribosomal protein S18 acetylase RimI-like enzyme
VLHLVVDDDGGAVRALRDAVFVAPLARPLSWPFVPHVTLADGAADPDRLPSAAAALAGYRRDARFERVHLLEEQRREPDGARVWTPIADAGFGRPAVVGRGGLDLELAVTERLGPDAAAWRRAHGDGGGRPLAVTATREGRIAGTAEGRLRDDEAQLLNLVVDPEARRQGVGRHLLAAFASEAAARGAGHVTTLAPAGEAAEALLGSSGFVPVSTLPGWRLLRRDL